MANNLLKSIYSRLYGKSFSYQNFAARLKMQKGIYLLQEMGVPVGNYHFTWYKHGPYSQALLDDMYSDFNEYNMPFSSDSEMAIDNLASALIVPSDSRYSSEDWAECLGSIHYLKNKYCSFSATDDEIVQTLMTTKPHLNDENANREALLRIRGIFG